MLGQREGPDGFRQFVDARSPSLLRSAWLLTGDTYLAEDLLQSALAKTWPHWNKLSVNGDVDAYLRRVMFTTYVSWWRRRWRHEIPTDGLPEARGSDGVTAGLDTRMVVLAALRDLPARQRAVIVLRFYEDLTEEQTARAMDVTVGTVKSQTARALTHLRSRTGLRDLVFEDG